MKRKLLMLLIGSMMLGMVGCANNKDDDSDKNTDSTKETKQEQNIAPTDAPTEAPTENKKKLTVEELLENALFCEYNKTIYSVDASGKFEEEYGEVYTVLSGETITCYEDDKEYEKVEASYEFDMDAFKDFLKASYDDEDMPEEDWEENYNAMLEFLGIVDGRITEKTEAYRFLEDDTWYYIEYDEDDDVWYKWDNEENRAKFHLELVVEYCREAELIEAENGYSLTSYVTNEDFMEEFGFDNCDKEAEINLYFDEDGVFERFEIYINDVEDGDFVYDSVSMTCFYIDDYIDEIVLPTNIEEF